MTAVILSIRGLHSISDHLPNIRGTPRYLTGSFPSLNWRKSRIWCFKCAGTAERKFSLFVGFALRSEILLKASRVSWIIVREWMLALENSIKSSAKQRRVSFRVSHLGWKLNAEDLAIVDCNIPKKTSITNTNKETTDPLVLALSSLWSIPQGCNWKHWRILWW